MRDSGGNAVPSDVRLAGKTLRGRELCLGLSKRYENTQSSENFAMTPLNVITPSPKGGPVVLSGARHKPPRFELRCSHKYRVDSPEV